MGARMIGTAVMVGALATSVAGVGMTAQAATPAPTRAGSVVAAQVSAPADTTRPPKKAIKKTTKKKVKEAPGTAFTAYGHGFRVTVKRGVLTIDDVGHGERKVKVSRSAFAKGVEFTGSDRGQTVELVIRSGKCKDTAGQNTGMRASLTYGETTFRGCAVEGALAIADT